MKKTIFILILTNLLLLPNLTYATYMPGFGDYAALIGIAGLAAGFIIASIVVLLHYLIAKNKLTGKRYFIMWLILFFGTPVGILLLFFIIIIIAEIGGGL